MHLSCKQKISSSNLEIGLHFLFLTTDGRIEMADSGATDRGLSDLRKAWKRARAAWKKDKEVRSC